ncbi:MAG: hypothetical protein D3923_03370 [Candidatus Electrothrix sp. AR3]|nr:hypothetical protein [Candidatus Electrothrix sp. AR3]
MDKKQNPENSFSLTLFNIYSKKKDSKDSPQTFAYTTRNGETHHIPLLQAKKEGGKAIKSAFHRLYPLAEKIFKAEAVFRTVPEQLLAELQEPWQAKLDLPPIRFLRAGGICLEEEYLFLYLEIQPDLPQAAREELAQAAVLLNNAFAYREQGCPRITRAFKEQGNEARGRSEQQIAQDHFQGNEELALIQGLSGASVTLREMFDTLAGPSWKPMLRDRFLLNSLLITPTDELAPTYDHDEQADLIRRARGMDQAYLPASLEDLSGYVVPVQTFANVLFMAANEGVAGHVKPAPPRPEFLLKQFASRYRTEYTLFFILAAYQHYRLVDLIRNLAKDTEGLEESGQALDKGMIERLRQIRKKLVVHELKYINTQPAFLTNYQQYYSGLRQGLNTEALVEKLRHSVHELDSLLADAEQREEKERKERLEKGEFWLAILAEAFALPYYLYNLLAHALHCSEVWALSITGIVTAVVITKTWLTMRRKKS